jgi:hypothetical protein
MRALTRYTLDYRLLPFTGGGDVSERHGRSRVYYIQTSWTYTTSVVVFLLLLLLLLLLHFFLLPYSRE